MFNKKQESKINSHEEALLKTLESLSLQLDEFDKQNSEQKSDEEMLKKTKESYRLYLRILDVLETRTYESESLDALESAVRLASRLDGATIQLIERKLI